MVDTNKKLNSAKRKDILSNAKKKTLEDLLKSEENAKIVRSKRFPDSPIYWYLLAFARIFLAFGQTGYIHPDEFHQSVQVMAYDVLEIDGSKPWEFSSASPIRSVVFSGFASLPYIVLKLLSPIFKYFFSIEILTPRVLLLAPRLFMTLLSFIADYCVFQIASICYVRPWQCLEVFAGSYIMLVFCTRTFSNSFELILFSLLLWRVCLSMVESLKIIRKENVLQDLYETAETMREKVKIVRIKSKLPPYNYVDSFLISFIVVLGVFIRPTFLIYSFIPLTYWLQRGVVTKELDFSYFNLRCASLLPGVFLTFWVCILADSFYYSTLTFSELLRGNITVASFTITPINFLLYNSNSNNLASHGFHPYLLHIAVNLPLLHGVLGLAGLWSVSKYFAHLLFRRFTSKPKVNSMATMLLCSFFVPVLALSVIPHQEARFLLPTLIPLVLLHSDKISIYALPKFRFVKNFLYLLWQVWNVLCVIFFGFMHQGSVTETMFFVHDYVASQPPHSKFHVFFSHMYTPPTFLLMRKIPVIGVTEDGRRYRVERSVDTHDLGSSLDVNEIYDRLKYVIDKDENGDPNIILCIAASLSDDLKREAPANASLNLLKKIHGHISTEHFPDFRIREEDLSPECNKACHIAKKAKEFSVDVFLIKFNAKSYKGKILTSETHSSYVKNEVDHKHTEL